MECPLSARKTGRVVHTPLNFCAGALRHRQKRMKQVKKLVQRGLYNPDKDNPFDLFLASARVRWTYYKETENILGQTFGMCVLQVRFFPSLTARICAIMDVRSRILRR
jgi:tRNA(Met) C34 N-acetyltransferase TmcA